jgi:hypothetical protein
MRKTSYSTERVRRLDDTTRNQTWNLVLRHDPNYDVFKFRRFRLNLIGFLKLPLGVSESALRDVIKQCSVNLLANYEARAERVRSKSRVSVKVP